MTFDKFKLNRVIRTTNVVLEQVKDKPKSFGQIGLQQPKL